jgi:hypothetical protein
VSDSRLIGLLAEARAELQRMGAVREPVSMASMTEGAARLNLILMTLDIADGIRLQRDEARRMYCEGVWHGEGDEDEMRQLSPAEIASRQGWTYLYARRS